MGKKRSANVSRHIKTSHKKNLINKKIVTQKVDRTHADINKNISNQAPKMQAQSMSMDQLKKLLSGQAVGQKTRQKNPKLSLQDTQYLERLLKKWGSDYNSMSKDVKLNRMQWTPAQIQKKHKAFNKILEQQQNA